MIGNVIKDFKVIRELGKGGMATVFLVEHQILGSTKALKVLNSEFVRNEHIRKRFVAEAKSMAKMEHRNIISVTDLIDEGDTVAFLMEYVNGETLKEYSERRGRLSEGEIRSVFTQMLEAVGYVHRQNLIHRDVKPSNFMINKDGKVKLMDFGIAKNTDASSAEYTQTNTGMQMGTPMYMSPEQIKSSKDVGPQTDIYSLGVVLWQMVTGRKPYDTSAISSFDMQLKIVQEDLPPTNSIWDNCIKEATQKNTYLRFKSISAFEGALPGHSSEHTVIEEQKPSGSNSTDKRGNSEPLENRFAQASVKPTSEKRSYALPIFIVVIVLGFVGFYFSMNGGYDSYGNSDDDNDGVINSMDLCPNEWGNDHYGCNIVQVTDTTSLANYGEENQNAYKWVAFENNSSSTVWLSIATLSSNKWGSAGWYKVEKGAKYTWAIPAGYLTNKIYWYAEGENGEEWANSNGYPFCVTSSESFNFLPQGNCQIEKRFHELVLTGETTYQGLSN